MDQKLRDVAIAARKALQLKFPDGLPENEMAGWVERYVERLIHSPGNGARKGALSDLVKKMAEMDGEIAGDADLRQAANHLVALAATYVMERPLLRDIQKPAVTRSMVRQASEAFRAIFYMGLPEPEAELGAGM